MTPDDIINENDSEEQEEEQVENIIDLNNYGMKPYSWRYEGEGGGGSFAPDITDPQDGDTLVYNATQQKWVNGAGGSGGGVLVVHVLNEEAKQPLDKTWNEINSTFENGTLPVLTWGDSLNTFVAYLTKLLPGDSQNSYMVLFGEDNIFETYDPDDYPVRVSS